MKLVSHFLFSMVLIFSILAPSMVNLYMANEEAIVLMDTSEEENKEKTEKELEEKILQLAFVAKERSILLSTKKIAVPYIENHVNFSLEINLPPPERAVL